MRAASEAEAGQVAVAQRNARRSRQRAINRGEQTGDEGGVGREADSSSLGQDDSLSWRAAPGAASVSGNNLCIPDAKSNGFVCIAAFLLLQRNM